MSKNGPDIAQYLVERAESIKQLSKEEGQAFKELNVFVQKTLDTVNEKQNIATADSNQFERQYTGFFLLAISFIVGGMLAVQPGLDATLAARLLYIATIMTASVAAVFLFSEYYFVNRLFGKAIKANDDIMQYIVGGNWKSPTELRDWMFTRQSRVPKHSTQVIMVLEFIFVPLSFILLALWLIETLFNPSWTMLIQHYINSLLAPFALIF